MDVNVMTAFSIYAQRLAQNNDNKTGFMEPVKLQNPKTILSIFLFSCFVEWMETVCFLAERQKCFCAHLCLFHAMKNEKVKEMMQSLCERFNRQLHLTATKMRPLNVENRVNKRSSKRRRNDVLIELQAQASAQVDTHCQLKDDNKKLPN